MGRKHTELEDLIIEEISRKYPKTARCFKRKVGYYRHRPYTPRCTVKVGSEGQADLYGFIKATEKDKFPIPFEIEVKTPKDRLREDQVIWQKFCESYGIPHVVARSVEDVLKFLERVLRTC